MGREMGVGGKDGGVMEENGYNLIRNYILFSWFFLVKTVFSTLSHNFIKSMAVRNGSSLVKD